MDSSYNVIENNTYNSYSMSEEEYEPEYGGDAFPDDEIVDEMTVEPGPVPMDIVKVDERNEPPELEPVTVEKAERITTPYMTKYEKAKLVGIRATQISEGADIMVDLHGETDPLMIAIKELKQRKCPLIIRRRFPDGSYEDWTTNELIIEDRF